MATKRNYVYLHRRKDNNEVFYVGKGVGTRAWKKTTRSEWWKRIEAKYGRIVEIYQDNLDEVDAFILEAKLILEFGRENLCNLNAGGKGGINPSEETRKKMSENRKGKKFTEAHKQKLREASTGRHHSEETRLKLRLANLGKPGRPMSESNRVALNKAVKGIPRTPEHCAKISAAKMGKPGTRKSPEECLSIKLRLMGHLVSEETRNKIGDANRGRKHTPEELAKILVNNRKSNMARRLHVRCSNGMIFEYTGDAETWLRANGFPSASRANIVSCCTGKLKTAYGFSWTRDLQ